MLKDPDPFRLPPLQPQKRRLTPERIAVMALVAAIVIIAAVAVYGGLK